MAEQVEIFRHMHAFAQRVRSGDVVGLLRDIDADGVKGTVEKIRLAAVEKSKKG